MKRLFFIILLFITSFSFAQNQEDDNNNIIFFYNATLSDGKDIKCSGFDLDFHINTYQILQHNGIIDSMFVRTNEKQLEEMDKKTWIYSCDFKVSRQQLKKDCINLNIQNLDGNCSLYINNKFVKHYNNSFMEYCDNVKQFIKKGKNTIELRFAPKDSIRTHQRSPQYLYGWDWYPKMLAPRINAIYLSFEDNKPYIDYANIQTQEITYTNDSIANGEMILNIHFRKPLKENHKLIVTDCIQDFDYAVSIDKPMVFSLQPNNSGYYSLKFTLKEALLWYPNNMGPQYLYKVNLCLDKKENIINSTQFGVRTIKLIRKSDKWGECFYFKINNQPTFIKGANYIMTYANSTEDVISAANANMNMLRIWGGSDYGSDEFFDYCDKYGIMIWQDYPFSTELYPIDKNFINNVKQEVIQNLIRISGHPSLALLCGNNEIWEGWHHWGWKDTVKDTIQAVRDYNYLFKEVLDSLSYQYVPTLSYIHSSPVNHGWGNEKSLTDGDCHYYGVWWADSNFETYTHKIPRFMSEYGFQGAMNPETAEQFCSHPYTKDNENFAIHQKHPRGFSLIDKRIKEWFGDYKNDEQYILYSQMTQSEGMKLAMEAHRIHKPYCMGTLFWQYNEPYPCVGWGCIDFSGEPKPLYYTAQKAFQPIIFAIDKNNVDSIKIFICNDLTKDTTLTYKIKIMNQNDSVHYINIGEKHLVKANETQLLASIAYKDIINFNKNTDYLFIEGYYGDEFISNYAFFCYPKDYIDFKKYLETIDEYYFADEE